MKHALLVFLVLISLGAQGKKFETRCTVITYNAIKSQTNGNPNVTADGTHIDHRKVSSGRQRIVAVSRDLLHYIPYGSIVHIEGHGKYIVADTMNKRFSRRVDILIPDNRHFKKRSVRVILIEKGSGKLKYNSKT